MKEFYKYIAVPVVVLAAVGCVNADLISDIPSAESGDEVMFGLSLQNSDTKTVYGEPGATAFPIYWENGDKVQIFSPQCLTGRRSAEYKVTVDEQQNYADDLTRTGEYGVQWGEATTADFYSLYPSGTYSLSDDMLYVEGVTINYSQNIEISGNIVESDMEDCLMYAATKEVTKRATVELSYRPISTVVYVTLTVGDKVDENKTDEFTIQQVKLLAPSESYIAGKFSLKIADGTFGSFDPDAASNIVMAQISDPKTGGYLKLINNESASFPLFLAPDPNLNMQGWQIQVVANGTVYTKTIEENLPLVSGKIHKISLPKLMPSTTEWNVKDWMTNIPRNVYLSEISIPGTWNSMNTDSQNNTSLTAQYDNGARAFHIDTRWKRSGSYNRYTYELGVAIGGSGNATGGDDQYMTAGATFNEALNEIVGQVKPSEYMVLVCTFAQNSAQHNGVNGWIDAINECCANNDQVYDASSLSSTTLVGDVLNKVIVIINGDSNYIPEDSKCLFVNVPMTIPSKSDFESNYLGNIYNYSDESDLTIYHTHAQASVQADGTNAGTNDRQDEDRGYIPSYNERVAVINDILNWSKDNVSKVDYAHDTWIYLGLGGYYAKWNNGFLGIGSGWKEIENAYELVASDFCALINERISQMGQTVNETKIPYYPLGIVLINNGVDNASTLKNILMLNTKYKMQFDSTKPGNYNDPL